MRLSPLRMLVRDWRGGELGVLLGALLIAVAIVSGISAFTGRLQNALEQDSHRFLAADRVLSSSQEADARWLLEASARGLRTARTLSFPSMLHSGDQAMHLTALKAVSEHYPLRGVVLISERPYGLPREAGRGPAAGNLWLEPRLFALLDVAPGDLINVGHARLRVTAALRSEPDRAGGNIASYAPRVMMNYRDLAATGLVQPGSRIEYRQLYAGEAGQIDRFSEWLTPQLVPGQEWLDVGSNQRSIGRTLARAEQFLLLASSLGVVLAGVAMALAAHRFSERHYPHVAVMKSLGSSSNAINRLYGSSLLLLAAVASVLGCGLGWAIQESFFLLLRESLPLPPGRLTPPMTSATPPATLCAMP